LSEWAGEEGDGADVTMASPLFGPPHFLYCSESDLMNPVGMTPLYPKQLKNRLSSVGATS